MKIEIENGKIIINNENINEQLIFDDCGFSNNKKILENEKQLNNNEESSKTKELETLKQIITDNFKSDIKDKFDEDKQKTIDPTRFNTGQVKITMSTLDRPDIDQIANIDTDTIGYDRIRVFDSMERKSNVTVINDGPDNIYFIVNRNGINHEEESWTQNEIMMYPGEAWKIYNVCEIRIRSETQGNKYRVTEDDVITLSTIRSVM